MKIYHFVLIFACFMVIVCVIADTDISSRTAVKKEESAIEGYVEDAVLYGAGSLADDVNSGRDIDKDKAVEAFFTSLFSSLNILDAKSTQELVRLCTPVIVVTDLDGFYVCYQDEVCDDCGAVNLISRWSDKIFYSYDDGKFIYVFNQSEGKAGTVCRLIDFRGILGENGTESVHEVDVSELNSLDAELYNALAALAPESILFNPTEFENVRTHVIADTMRRELTTYCNVHNRIAQENGFTYVFSVPDIDTSTVKTISDIGMYVMFQGYPYADGTKRINMVSFEASNIVMREHFYCDEANGVYHRNGCSRIVGGMERLDSKEECAKRGLYACDECCYSVGAHR